MVEIKIMAQETSQKIDIIITKDKIIIITIIIKIITIIEDITKEIIIQIMIIITII
jgi:hypothetical protein